ncbi:SIMPL domain-containing protein [Pedomonas sp. V897]|uniref:SIMPL domain-containing protein n=1 Tax=Pedomonas sp. V897 TaxID=3446482 RepID=UPI003EDEEB96
MTDRNAIILGAAALVAVGVGLGGYFIGDGFKNARRADRSVTVRGLAERDVTADIATWTITYTANGHQLETVQGKIDKDTETIRAFLKGFGFPEEEITTAGISVNQYYDNSDRVAPERRNNIHIRQTLLLRTRNVEAAQKAHAAMSELVRRGVVLEGDGTPVVYSFTKLNSIKPEMIAAATKDARAGAEQFAKDSGSRVGGIKQASQGYFSILPRDGEGGQETASPYQKVRVVTTIDFYLED